MAAEKIPGAWQPEGDSKPNPKNISAVAADPFIAALLDMSPSENRRRSPLRLVSSLAIHIVLIAAIIIIPGYFVTKAVIPKTMTETLLVAPPPPGPPPPPPEMTHKAVKFPASHAALVTPFVAPKAIPRKIEVAQEEAPPLIETSAGVIGGTLGGVQGGVLGGILGGVGSAVQPPPQRPTPSLVRVGGDIKPPRLLSKIEPIYPPLAQDARIQGTVELDAVINPEGDVVKIHAVDGPALLIPAAIAAVKQWKYDPTYLNGQAVSLAMEVTVSFHLG
jgi:periplasmic protein TonB